MGSRPAALQLRVGGGLHHLAPAAARCHFCASGWMAVFGPETVNCPNGELQGEAITGIHFHKPL